MSTTEFIYLQNGRISSIWKTVFDHKQIINRTDNVTHDQLDSGVVLIVKHGKLFDYLRSKGYDNFAYEGTADHYLFSKLPITIPREKRKIMGLCQ